MYECPPRESYPRTTHYRNHLQGETFVNEVMLTYNPIHACQCGCCLFWKELEDATECPSCHKSRYAHNSKTIHVKILRHFPLILHLQKMYNCTRLAELMKAHAGRESEDKVMRYVVDSKAWNHVNNRWPWFAKEER